MIARLFKLLKLDSKLMWQAWWADLLMKIKTLLPRVSSARPGQQPLSTAKFAGEEAAGSSPCIQL